MDPRSNIASSDQCPVTLTVSNLIADSDKHLALQQEKIQRRRHHLHHHKYHHRHEHVAGCPLHRQQQQHKLHHHHQQHHHQQQQQANQMPEAASPANGVNSDLMSVNSSIESTNLHGTFHSTDLTAPIAGDFTSLQFNCNSNLAKGENNCRQVACEMNFAKVKNDFDSQNLHSNYPHLPARASHCHSNEMQFGKQIYQSSQKLKEKISSSSSSSCNFNSNSNIEQVQMLPFNSLPSPALPSSSSSMLPSSSSSSPPSASSSSSLPSASSSNNFVCTNLRKEITTEFASEQIKRANELGNIEQSNKFQYKLRSGPSYQVNSFDTGGGDKDFRGTLGKGSTLLKNGPSLVTILAVVAFIGLSATILSNVNVNGKSTIARLEDSFASSFTFLNSTVEKSSGSFPAFSSMNRVEFTSSPSSTSGSNVFAKTGGFVFKSFYSTKGAAESLMAALTSLVSSSEKRRAQLASMKSSSSSSSFSSNSSDSTSKVNEQIDEANANSVLDPEEEANLVSVQTSCTKFVGTIEDGSFAFKGIPYALPPTGDLRWSRPVPMSCESKDAPNANGPPGNGNFNETAKRTFHALKFAPDCFQVNPFTKKFTGSEDCLYLNIWTPTLDESAKLPVLVWIHGGFLQFGSSHSLIGPSGHLAHKLNVVLISINYRLHALGFLALELLSNSGPNSARGNYGLWDQLTALNWIKSNIESFGGDADAITLAGSDGSAGTILALASNSLLTGNLFQKAWLIGPALYANKSYESVSTKNLHNFQARSGCYNVSCLRALSPQKVTKLFLGSDDPAFRINDQNDLPIQGIYPEQLINIDGELVTEPTLTPSLKFSAESKITQDFLIGTSSESIDFWPGPVDLSSWTWSQYVKYVTTSLDSFGPKLSSLALSLYPPKKIDSRVDSSFISPSASHELRLDQSKQQQSSSSSSSSMGDMSHFSYSFTATGNGKSDGEKKITASPTASPTASNDEKSKSTASYSTTRASTSTSTASSDVVEESRSNNEVLDEDTFTISLSPSYTVTLSSSPSSTASPKIASASNTAPTSRRSNGLSSSFSSSPSITGSDAAVTKNSGSVDGAFVDATLPPPHPHPLSNSALGNHLGGPSEASNVSQVSSSTGTTMKSTSMVPSSSSSSLAGNSIHSASPVMNSGSKLNSPIFDSPEKLYSSLVSDVRQICPVFRLAKQLASQLIHSGDATTAQKGPGSPQINLYTITGHPSSPVRVYDYPSKMAFHLWDAAAFFSPSLDTILHKAPISSDLLFQQTIQSLVKQFMHQTKGVNRIIPTLDQSHLSSFPSLSSPSPASPLNKDTVHTSVPISVNTSNSLNRGQDQIEPVGSSDTPDSMIHTLNNNETLHVDVSSSKSSTSFKSSSPSPSSTTVNQAKHRRNSLLPDSSLLASASVDEILLINASHVSYVTKFKEAQCNFWQSQGLLEYAWVS